MKRTMLISGVSACVLSLSLTSAWAQQDAFPSRPITMIVTSAAGGGTDVAARLSSSLAEQTLGQKIIVENKPGAGGALAIQAMLAAKHDGYTMSFVFNTPLTVQPHMTPVSYTPQSYIPLVMTDAITNIFCVKKDFPANTGAELVKLIRDNPDKYTYGVDGPAGMVHLAGERIFRALKIDARAIPFDGAGQILTGFQGGVIDIYGGSIPPILPFYKNGSVKCLITSTAQKVPIMPEAASATDLGVPEAATVNWKGVVAPADTPPDRLAIVEKAYLAAVKSDKYKEFAASQGGEAVGEGHEQFRRVVDNEYAAFKPLVDELGLKK